MSWPSGAAGPAGEPMLSVAGPERERAVGALLRYFGEDDARSGVTLEVDGERIGHLARADALTVIADSTRGYGSSAGSGLPGLAGYELLRLRCPVAGCTAPEQLRVSFDEDHPPHCPQHPDVALRLLS